MFPIKKWFVIMFEFFRFFNIEEKSITETIYYFNDSNPYYYVDASDIRDILCQNLRGVISILVNKMNVSVWMIDGVLDDPVVCTCRLTFPIRTDTLHLPIHKHSIQPAFIPYSRLYWHLVIQFGRIHFYWYFLLFTKLTLISISLVSSITTTYRVRVARLYTMLGVVLTDMSTPMLKTYKMLMFTPDRTQQGLRQFFLYDENIIKNTFLLCNFVVKEL